MTQGTTMEIFQEHLKDYLRGSKKEKGIILDHICKTTKLTRDTAQKKFKRLQHRPIEWSDGRGRPQVYSKEVDTALYELWELSTRLCGELLHPIIGEYIDLLERNKQWKHSSETTTLLKRMSLGRVKLCITQWKHKEGVRKGYGSTVSSPLKRLVPVSTDNWKDKAPGYGQLDTVVHCGSSLLGDMVYTLNYTDCATSWGHRRAQWNKGQNNTLESIQSIQQSLPFPLLGLHPDNGSEFINWILKDWCDEQDIVLERSRSGKKNDNAHVEQKNGHIVRRFLGYERIDERKCVSILNEYYLILDTFLNHFVPVRHCIDKEKLPTGRYKRIYDCARTPYARVLEESSIDQSVKDRLIQEHEILDILELQRERVRLEKLLWKTQKKY